MIGGVLAFGMGDGEITNQILLWVRARDHSCAWDRVWAWIWAWVWDRFRLGFMLEFRLEFRIGLG